MTSVIRGSDDLDSAISALPKSSQVFTSTGTWTKPSGVKTVRVQLVGGGGGGGGHSESGGGGGYCEKIIDVVLISSVSVTVGGGGYSSTYNVVNGPGGTSSFGTHCSAGGGGASTPVTGRHSGGVGGVGVGGDLNLYGGGGGGHDGNSGGPGGISYFGGGEPGCHANHRSSLPHTFAAPGTGGTGGYTTHTERGTAKTGIVIVWEYE